MQTKFEIFCAYLPYSVMRESKLLRSAYLTIEDLHHFENHALILRPLSLLNTPMKHPVTGEEIENPAKYISDRTGKHPFMIGRYLDGFYIPHLSHKNFREIDTLALSLHFDIYGAIERGFAIEVQL